MVRVDEICSIDFLNHKLFAPCNTVESLSFQYGENWNDPQVNGGFHNMDYLGIYSEKEWLRAFKFYDSNGRLDLQFTIDRLNQWNIIPNATIIKEIPNE